MQLSRGLLLFLPLLASCAPPKKPFRREAGYFNINLQRYASPNCSEPIGTAGTGSLSRRKWIGGDGDGKCTKFKYGDAFQSVDWAWYPRREAHGDRALDDPELPRGKKQGKKRCSIMLYEDEKCGGPPVTILNEANTWKNIDECFSVVDRQGAQKEANSVKVRCYLSLER